MTKAVALLVLLAFTGCGSSDRSRYPSIENAIAQCGERGVRNVVDKSRDTTVNYYNLVICNDGRVIKADS